MTAGLREICPQAGGGTVMPSGSRDAGDRIAQSGKPVTICENKTADVRTDTYTDRSGPGGA